MSAHPSTETSGLAEALAKVIYDNHGWHAADSWETDHDGTRDHYRQHADAALAWLIQRLTEDDVVLAAARAINHVLHEDEAASPERQARAALAAAAALVGGGDRG